MDSFDVHVHPIQFTLFIFLNKNMNTLYWINSKLCNILLCALFKTEQKAADLKSINIRYLLTIYRHLAHNDIPVIEDNTFSNLPNLQTLWVALSMICTKYNPNMPIHVIGNVLYITQVADKCAFRTLQIYYRYRTPT